MSISRKISCLNSIIPAERRAKIYDKYSAVLFAVYLLTRRFCSISSYFIPVIFVDDVRLCFPSMRPAAAVFCRSLDSSLSRTHSVNISGVFVM